MPDLENWISLVALIIGPAAIVVFSFRAIRRGEARALEARRTSYRTERTTGATHTEALQRSGAAEEEVFDLNK
ncbi:MAG: hypothetical protein WCL53_08250 [Chloroflexota bacterium]